MALVSVHIFFLELVLYKYLERKRKGSVHNLTMLCMLLKNNLQKFPDSNSGMNLELSLLKVIKMSQGILYSSLNPFASMRFGKRNFSYPHRFRSIQQILLLCLALHSQLNVLHIHKNINFVNKMFN